MQPVIFCNRVPKFSKLRFHQAKKTTLFAKNLIGNCQIPKSSVKFRNPFQNLCPRFWRPCFVSAPEICLFMRSQNISKAAFFPYKILRKFYINWHHSTTIPGYSSCLIGADVCKKMKTCADMNILCICCWPSSIRRRSDPPLHGVWSRFGEIRLRVWGFPNLPSSTCIWIFLFFNVFPVFHIFGVMVVFLIISR